MKRVLVTGSGGFVGQILTAGLRAEGCEVWGVDRAHPPRGADDHRMLSCDLQDEQEVDRILDEVRPDRIVHLAAQSSAGRSFHEPHLTLKNNVLPILHILEHLRVKSSTARLLAVGSADVYGPVDQRSLPLTEAHAAHPASPYALSKWLQERCCEQYASLYGVDVVMTRSFNHTGAGQSDAFVLSSFARQIVEIQRGLRKPRVDVGNVEVRRDFSDVKDVCRAYRMLLEDGKTGEIYNVCSGKSYSLRDLLGRLASIAGVEIEVRVEKTRVRPLDTVELRGDNRKITADTGWSPRVAIDETLESLLDYWSAVTMKSRG